MKPAHIAVLSLEEINQIHRSSLNLLEETGIKIQSDRVLDLVKSAGALVDKSTSTVRFPQKASQKYLNNLKSTVKIYNRTGDSFLTLGDGTIHCASGHNAIYVQEFGSDTIRDATKQDVADFAFVTNALPSLEIAGIVLMPNTTPCMQASLVHAMDAMFNNTTKHIFFSPGTALEASAILEISRLAIGDSDLSNKPPCTCQLSPTSPLTWETGAVEALLLIAESGIPLTFLPGPMGGAACPITLAGHLIQYNTEMLSGIIISQIAKPGCPVIYGGGWSIFDMRESMAKIATPESVLLRIAGCQMARFYNIPCHSMGMDSDSHCYDEQQGMEKMFTTMGDFMVGVDLIVNGGMYSSGVTASLEQLVIDNEISSILQRFSQGIDFSKEKQALDVIKEVGPGGEFLSHLHTASFLRSGEHRIDELSSRLPLRKWQDTGRITLVDKAREVVRDIRKNHSVKPLEQSIQRSIEKVIVEFEGKFA